MKGLTKRMKTAREVVGLTSAEKVVVNLDEAVKRIKSAAKAKFDETVDLAVRLGIDTAKSDQNVRGTVILPGGTGKSVRIAVLAQGDKQKEATEAGADYVGGAELAQKIQGGWFDFDVAIATPDMMKEVGKLGKILGPRGLMPNPKTGTVTFEVTKAVKEFKAGKVEYRNDKSGNVHVPVGKASFAETALLDNLKAVIGAIIRSKPRTAKGTYLKGIFLSSTMGPGIKVDLNSIKDIGR